MTIHLLIASSDRFAMTDDLLTTAIDESSQDGEHVMETKPMEK